MTLPLAESAPPAPAHAGDPELDALKEVEPWALPPDALPEVRLNQRVAAALERVAHRIRHGEIPLPPDADPSSDEAAMALALAAVLRSANQ